MSVCPPSFLLPPCRLSLLPPGHRAMALGPLLSKAGTFRGLQGHWRKVNPKTISRGARLTRVSNGCAELCGA